MKLVGIDPGMSGCLAQLEFDGAVLVDAMYVDVPAIAGNIEAATLQMYAANWVSTGAEHVIMEQLQAMPSGKRPAVASWKLGVCFGHLLQAIASVGLPLTLVTPQQWKKAMGVRMGPGMSDSERKEAGRHRALQLFPDQRRNLYRVKDHNRAEALLVGEWGRRHLGGAV